MTVGDCRQFFCGATFSSTCLYIKQKVLQGVDLRSLESFEYFGDPDYDSFSYICIAVEIFDYHKKYQPVEADAFIVSDDYTGFASLDDPTIDMDNNYAPTKQYCYVVLVPNYSESLAIYDSFLNGD